MFSNPLPPGLLLRQLQEEIQSTIVDSWLFPQRGTIAGFLGAGPVVIVGRRPGLGDFRDESAELFYGILAEFGLENAHLTNFIKSRGKREDPDPSDRDVHERFFNRELEIISAKYAVATMGDAYDQVSAFLFTKGVRPVARLPQYASMKYGAGQVAKFRTAIQQLASMARRNAWIR